MTTRGLFTLMHKCASANMTKTMAPTTYVSTRTMKNSKFKSNMAMQSVRKMERPTLTSVMPAPHACAKIIFSETQAADFKYIWLRDNCQCNKCVDPNTKQKLLDTPTVDVNIKPRALKINEKGQLEVRWTESGGEHISIFESKWLYKYGQSFIHDLFESDSMDFERTERPQIKLWNRSLIWEDLPEISYKEFSETDEGVRAWLEKLYVYGVAILRGVPTTHCKVTEVVERFSYVKETQYGRYFDVINKPEKGQHLAFSGVFLPHHTDMNYREKSPGIQLLHCLKANDPKASGSDPGGRSFFVDGFRAAKWMEDNEPAAFHILTSTAVRFSIQNEGLRYSATWPIICLNDDGDVIEIHYNNRTMKPLQAPAHQITPFYHAYRLFTEKLRESSNALEFQMLPGDLVAFNNRRVLHGRTAYDPNIVDRHLQGCYCDIDEVFSKFDLLHGRKNPSTT